MRYPECNNDLVKWIRDKKYHNPNTKEKYVIPYMKKRKPLPSFISKIYTELYEEATSILSLSPKASAALSRTCLQLLLQEYSKAKKGKLSNEINEAVKSKKNSRQI